MSRSVDQSKSSRAASAEEKQRSSSSRNTSSGASIAGTKSRSSKNKKGNKQKRKRGEEKEEKEAKKKRRKPNGTKTRRSFTPEEVKAIMDRGFEKDSCAERNRAFFVVGVKCGFRVSELCKARVSDVWDGKEFRDSLTIDGSRMKGSGHTLKPGQRKGDRMPKDRSSPLDEDCKIALKPLVKDQGPDAFLFRPSYRVGEEPKPMTTRQMLRVIKSAAQKAGIEDLGKIGNHSMRKRHARAIFEASGHNLVLTREAMGHKSSAVTEVYLGYEAEKVRQAQLNQPRMF